MGSKHAFHSAMWPPSSPIFAVDIWTLQLPCFGRWTIFQDACNWIWQQGCCEEELCVCLYVCVCERERGRGRERESRFLKTIWLWSLNRGLYTTGHKIEKESYFEGSDGGRKIWSQNESWLFQASSLLVIKIKLEPCLATWLHWTCPINQSTLGSWVQLSNK